VKHTKRSTYSTAFSAGALLFKESEAVVGSISDEEAFIRGDEKVDYGCIPVNSEASKKRLGTEVVTRLRNLGDAQFIRLYKGATKEDKLLILFYAACKTYRLIAGFMLEIVLDKWYHMDYELRSDDFKNFLFRQMDKHPELEDLTPLTISRRASTVILMIKELGLIKDGKLQKKEYNPTILKGIAASGDAWFLEVLLLNEEERNEILS